MNEKDLKKARDEIYQAFAMASIPMPCGELDYKIDKVLREVFEKGKLLGGFLD